MGDLDRLRSAEHVGWCSGYYEASRTGEIPGSWSARRLAPVGIGPCRRADGTTRRRVEAADVELHRYRLRFPEVVRRHHEGVARALAVLRDASAG